VNFTAAIRSSGETSGIIVYLELRDPIRMEALSRLTVPNQSFQGGETRTISGEIPVPSTITPGQYNIALGVFSAGWKTQYLWNYQAARLTVADFPPPPQPTTLLSIGINMSGAEYSWETFPGPTDLDYIKRANLKLIRLPIAWERAQPKLNGPLDGAYVEALRTCIRNAAARGLSVIIDLHNYGRYNNRWAQEAAANYGYVAVGGGDAIGSTAVPFSAFADFWMKMAMQLKGTPGLAYYDIMNEPHDMGGTSVWPTAAQAAVDAIRTTDRETAILVEGTQWASAYYWQWDNGNLRVNDPANNLLYEAHLYFDGDGSGKYRRNYDDEGAYPTVGTDRVQPFLNWLRQNNVRGFLGEFGVPNNDPRWLTVLDNFIGVLRANGISGTYWNYTYRSPGGVSWWPVNDPMSIRLDNGQSNPQMGILSRYGGN
jgi:endoglucanase